MTSQWIPARSRAPKSALFTKMRDLLPVRRSWVRLAHIDVPERLKPILPIYISQILFALLCFCVSVIMRLFTDLMLPGAGPFALMLPAALVATLFGRWLSGVVCLTISCLYAWYYVLPVHGSFSFLDPTDGPRVVVNVVSGFFVIALAELFRSAVTQALREREMLLVELEHRVKNNFASVASMLRLQLRQSSDETTQQALQAALGRLESFARANTALYRGYYHTGTVEMSTYLGGLCRSLEIGLSSPANVRIRCEAEPLHIERDRAIILGLLVNEVATNSIKHAFVEREDGLIQVRFFAEQSGHILSITDDGRGFSGEQKKGSLGLTLIDALSKQANGSMDVNSSENGTSFRFEFAA